MTRLGATAPKRYARLRTALAGGEDRPVAVEAQPVRGGLGEIELPATDVRAAIDHPHVHAAAALAQRQLGAAGQGLVGVAKAAVLQPPAAAELDAVQPGTVP